MALVVTVPEYQLRLQVGVIYRGQHAMADQSKISFIYELLSQ